MTVVKNTFSPLEFGFVEAAFNNSMERFNGLKGRVVAVVRMLTEDPGYHSQDHSERVGMLMNLGCIIETASRMASIYIEMFERNLHGPDAWANAYQTLARLKEQVQLIMDSIDALIGYVTDVEEAARTSPTKKRRTD